MTGLAVLAVPGLSAGDRLLHADVDAAGRVACLVARGGRTVARDGFVFATYGERLFGLPDLRGGPDPYEVTSGCATAGGGFVSVGPDSPHLWA